MLTPPPTDADQDECGGQEGCEKELPKDGQGTNAKTEEGWHALDGEGVGGRRKVERSKRNNEVMPVDGYYQLGIRWGRNRECLVPKLANVE